MTTSKTKQFCETSFKNGKLRAVLTASYQRVLWFFHSICVKCCACHEKVLSRKIILASLKIWCSKMQPLSGHQRPDLLTALMKMSLALRLPREMHLCRSSWHVPRLPSFLEMLQNPCVLLTFEKVHRPLRLPRETTSERPKVVRTLVFIAFWLRNVLRATTTCTFSTSQLPKVVRTWCVLYILTSKCASRHNGVQFFISHLARWLRTRRFSEPTFRPSGATNHWKNTVFRDFPTFSRTWASFFWLFLFSDLLSSTPSLWLFCLCFICPYCRKFDFLTSFDKYGGIYFNTTIFFGKPPMYFFGVNSPCRPFSIHLGSFKYSSSECKGD